MNSVSPELGLCGKDWVTYAIRISYKLDLKNTNSKLTAFPAFLNWRRAAGAEYAATPSRIELRIDEGPSAENY